MVDLFHKHLPELASRDKAFQKAFALVGYPPAKRDSWPAGFTTLLRIIAGQQISEMAADAIWRRVKPHALSPQAFAGAGEDTLRQAGLSRAKIRAGQTLALAIIEGELDLPALASCSDEGVINLLTKWRGIGPWTAQNYLLIALNRLDCFPSGDLALQNGLRLLYNLEKRPDARESLALVEKWRPWRGVGAKFLWHYLDNNPEQ